METLETKTPELGSTSDSPTVEKKESKAEAKPVAKETKQERPTLFEQPKAKQEKEPSLYDLFEQKAEKNPPLESLAQDEQALVVENQTAQNLSAANSELVGVEPNTPQEAAAIAGATFNEAVRERIDNGEEPTPDMLDGAMNDTAEILGLEPNDIEQDDPELPPEVIDEEPQEPTEIDPPESIDPIQSSEEGQDDPDQVDPIDPPVPPIPPVNPPGPSPNNAPPAPPVPPAGSPPTGGSPPPGGPGGPRSPGGGHGGPGFGPPGPNVANALNANPWLNPNVATSLAAGSRANRHSHWPYVLAGGVVGYLVGRRRGRIKTEKKLLPVQKKLERQVGDLEYQVASREARIRKLAYEKATSHPHIFVELPKRLKELQELQKASLKKKDFAPAKKTERTMAKEAAAAMVSAELLGKVATITDRVEHVKGEDAPKRRVITAEAPKPAADMTVAELLVVASQIPVEDRDLRHLYESGRIDQRGLRRVLEAYLRGERYDKVLFESVKSKNTVESLPAIRESLPDAAGTVSQSQLNVARVDMSADDPSLANARKAYYQMLEHSESQREDPALQRSTVIIAIVLTGIAIAIVSWIF